MDEHQERKQLAFRFEEGELPTAREPSKASEPEEPIPQLNTTGRIAYLLDVPLHRVRWILKTRSDIQPTAYAGNLRLFNAASVARIRHEINATDARRCSRKGGARR